MCEWVSECNPIVCYHRRVHWIETLKRKSKCNPVVIIVPIHVHRWHHSDSVHVYMQLCMCTYIACILVHCAMCLHSIYCTMCVCVCIRCRLCGMSDMMTHTLSLHVNTKCPSSSYQKVASSDLLQWIHSQVTHNSQSQCKHYYRVLIDQRLPNACVWLFDVMMKSAAGFIILHRCSNRRANIAIIR